MKKLFIPLTLLFLVPQFKLKSMEGSIDLSQSVTTCNLSQAEKSEITAFVSSFTSQETISSSSISTALEYIRSLNSLRLRNNFIPASKIFIAKAIEKLEKMIQAVGRPTIGSPGNKENELSQSVTHTYIKAEIDTTNAGDLFALEIELREARLAALKHEQIELQNVIDGKLDDEVANKLRFNMLIKERDDASRTLDDASRTLYEVEEKLEVLALTMSAKKGNLGESLKNIKNSIAHEKSALNSLRIFQEGLEADPAAQTMGQHFSAIAPYHKEIR